MFSFSRMREIFLNDLLTSKHNTYKILLFFLVKKGYTNEAIIILNKIAIPEKYCNKIQGHLYTVTKYEFTVFARRSIFWTHCSGADAV